MDSGAAQTLAGWDRALPDLAYAAPLPKRRQSDARVLRRLAEHHGQRTPSFTRHVMTSHFLVFLAFDASALTLAALMHFQTAWRVQTCLAASWDLGAALFLVCSLIVFVTRTPVQLKADARAQADGHRSGFWLMMGGAIGACLIMPGHDDAFGPPSQWHGQLQTMLTLCTGGLSWLLMRALFAYRYAYEIYAADYGEPE